MQKTLNIFNGTLVWPKKDTKPEASATRSTDYSKGYNPKEIMANWDSLSKLVCSTICLILSCPLALRYRKTRPASRLFTTIVNAYEKNTRACRICLQEAFWQSKDNPNTPIYLWIGHLRVTANKLPNDCLIGGLSTQLGTFPSTM
jgi:hypothetical protein